MSKKSAVSKKTVVKPIPAAVSKAVKSAPAKPVAAAEVPAAPSVKVTKRSNMLQTSKLELGPKPARNRADHIKAAFEAVAKILPATAAECIKVLEEHGKQTGMNPNGTQASYLTYWESRGYLTDTSKAAK